MVMGGYRRCAKPLETLVLIWVRNGPCADANLSQAADSAMRRCFRELALPLVT